MSGTTWVSAAIVSSSKGEDDHLVLTDDDASYQCPVGVRGPAPSSHWAPRSRMADGAGLFGTRRLHDHDKPHADPRATKRDSTSNSREWIVGEKNYPSWM